MPLISQLGKLHKVYKWLNSKQAAQASCLLCLDRCRPGDSLCIRCRLSLPTLGLACDKCREPYPSSNKAVIERMLCPRCQKGNRAFDDCIVGLQYIHPVAEMLQQVKYNGNLTYLKPLTAQLLPVLEHHYADTPWPEALVPVPMHWWKLRRRGFNPACLIAKQLAGAVDIPILYRHLRKLPTDNPQMRLSIPMRERNIRNSFSIKQPIPLGHVAIVDDVMTTGATVEELSRMLKRHGIRQVDVWCIARTPVNR